MSDQPRYWFRAKRYGWGWGLPMAREGWIVLIAWLMIVLAVTPMLAVHRHIISLVVFTLAMAAGLIAVCYLKGEPPRWRWGDENKAPK